MNNIGSIRIRSAGTQLLRKVDLKRITFLIFGGQQPESGGFPLSSVIFPEGLWFILQLVHAECEGPS